MMVACKVSRSTIVERIRMHMYSGASEFGAPAVPSKVGENSGTANGGGNVPKCDLSSNFSRSLIQ